MTAKVADGKTAKFVQDVYKRQPVERLELSESPIFLVNPQVLHSFPPIDTLDVPLRTDIACKAGRAWKNRRRPFGRYSLPWQSVYRCSMPVSYTHLSDF